MTRSHLSRPCGLLPVFAAAALWLSAPAGGQVFVEDSPAATELLLAAEDRLAKGEPEAAAKSIQKLLDEHGDRLLELEPGRYSEARRVIARRLLNSPELLTAYRALYDPAATQLLDQAGHDRKALGELHRRYGLTDAGLDAALRLVGLDLESGEADGALVVLTQLVNHPSLESRRPLWLELKAVAALLLNERGDFDEARRLLAEGGGQAVVAELDRLASSLTVESIRSSTLSPLDVLPGARVPEQLQQSLWDLPIEGAEQFIRNNYQPEAQHLGEQFERGRYLNAMPFLAGGRLLINDGQGVMAVEPASGRLLWRQTIAEDDTLGGNMMRSYNVQPSGLDLNCVAASGRHVVAICGFGAMSPQYPFVEAPSSTWLACIDASTGGVLWSRKPEEVAEDLSESFWYGRPIISEGRVYVTIRRRQRTQFNDAYIVALELATGKPVWRRHLASIAITSRQIVPAYVHLVLDHGWLYVDTRLGTVARLSALDGAVDWLTVLDSANRPHGDAGSRSFEAAQPILTAAGLIILDAMGQAVRVIDPETGATTDKFSAQRWDWPVYLVRLGDGDVLSIGQQVHRFGGADLEERWVHDSRGEELRGRVAVTEDFAYLPIAAGLQPIDLRTGEAGKTLPIQMPANVLIGQGQLVALHRDAVRGYSSWAVASQQLRQRSAQRPDDPRPMLDLAWLALRTDHEDALVESLDRAVKAVAAPGVDDDARQSVFDAVLDMTEEERVQKDAELSRALFDRIALVVTGPRQEVAYRLALGAFHKRQSRPRDAVEQYQLILADPSYRDQVFKEADRAQPAGLEAQDRLRALIKEHGRGIYEAFDAYAAQRLEELGMRVDPDALLELAESHPMAEVVPRVLILAATRTAELDRPLDAISLLRRIRWESIPDDQAAAVFTREVELLENMGEPVRAGRVLRFMLAAYPSAAVTRAGQAVDPATWLRSLDAADEPAPAVELDTPLSAPTHVFPAALMRPIAPDPIAADPGGFLLRWDDRIEFRRVADLSVAWARPLAAAEDVSLLSMDKRRVWLWRPAEARLEALDTATGQPAWEARDLVKRVESIQPPPAIDPMNDPFRGRRFLQRNPRRFPGDPFAPPQRPAPPAGLFFAANDIGITVADTQGRAMTLDAREGRTVWQGATPVRRVSQLLIDERHVILSGFDGATEDARPLACVYDAQTGMLRHSIPGDTELQQPQWMGLGDDGRLIQVTRTRVIAYDLARGRPAWEARPEVPLNGEAGAWAQRGRLLVQTRDDNTNDREPVAPLGADLVWIDLADGKVVHRESMRGKLEPPLRVLPDAGRWFLNDTDRAIAINETGRPIWTDAIAAPGKFLDRALTPRSLVLLSVAADAELLKTHERRLFFLDRETGVLRHEQAVDAPAPIDRLEFTAGRLILTGPNVTAVFGAP